MFYGMNAWFLATLATGALWWIAGAGLPAWLKLAPNAAAQAYVGAWSRGGPVLALLAAGSAALGLKASFAEPDPKWAVGAAFMAAALLFTLLFMTKTGHAIRDQAKAAAAGDETLRLLRLWGRLHLVRSILASIGVFFFIWAAH